MVSNAVIVVAFATGLALLISVTVLLYHYYMSRRYNKDWGDPERFKTSLNKITSSNFSRRKLPHEANIGCITGRNKKSKRPKSLPSFASSPSISRASDDSVWKLLTTPATSTSSIEPNPNEKLRIISHHEFVLEETIDTVQPNIIESYCYSLENIFETHTLTIQTDNMLTRQSQSLPVGPQVPPARLNRTPSISSQGQIETTSVKGHRGSSPAIRTFTPEGKSFDSLMSSPPACYGTSRGSTPTPLLQTRQLSADMSRGSYNLSSSDGKIFPLFDGKAHSQTSLNSYPEKIGLRRSSRCLSPLLIPPRSPTGLSDTSSQSQSPGPISPLGSLKLDLYKKRDITRFLPACDQPGMPSYHGDSSLGRLHFRLKYNLDKSDLHVHIIEAHDLASSDQGGFNDPYIRLFITPSVDSRKRQTAIHRNEKNPVFDEEFKFPISQDYLKEAVLVFQVFDFDRYSRNDIVGEVAMRLDEYNVISNLEVWAEVANNRKPSGERQDILLSLSYLPSAERLTVVIIKARNLYSPPNKDTLDPCVKVYLLDEHEKRIKKKKTSGIKNTKDPAWNEAVSFSLSSSLLDSTSIEVCVLDQSNDLMGSDAVIGSCIIGPKETGAEYGHWQEMRQNLRRATAMWHVLT